MESPTADRGIPVVPAVAGGPTSSAEIDAAATPPDAPLTIHEAARQGKPFGLSPDDDPNDFEPGEKPGDAVRRSRKREGPSLAEVAASTPPEPAPAGGMTVGEAIVAQNAGQVAGTAPGALPSASRSRAVGESGTLPPSTTASTTSTNPTGTAGTPPQ